MALRGSRVLVTGATGFLGSHLWARAIAEGADAYGLSRRGDARDNRILRCDLADPEATRSVLSELRPDYVWHAAGRAASGREVELVRPTFSENLAATVNVLLAAHEIGCRRVIMSGSLEEPTGADGPPHSPYAASKIAGTAYAAMFHALYGSPVVTLRLSMLYGPGERNPHKLIPHVILSLLRGEAPRLGTGSRQIDWLYIDDAADAFVMSSRSDEVIGQALDIGTGETLSIRTLVESIVEEMDSDVEPEFGALPDRAFERPLVADTSRTSDLLGWSSRTGLSEGLRRTIDWFRHQQA
jgi:UDP-glucose 4-epimerase